MSTQVTLSGTLHKKESWVIRIVIKEVMPGRRTNMSGYIIYLLMEKQQKHVETFSRRNTVC